MTWFICVFSVLYSALFAVLAAVPQMIYTYYAEKNNLLNEESAKDFCVKSEKFSTLHSEYKNLLREYNRGPEDNNDYTGAAFGKCVLAMSYLFCGIRLVVSISMQSKFLAIATAVFNLGIVTAIFFRVRKFRRDYINFYSGNLKTLNTRFMRIFEEQIDKVSYFEHNYCPQKIDTTESACELITRRISALKWLTRMQFKYHTYWLCASVFGLFCVLFTMVIFL